MNPTIPRDRLFLGISLVYVVLLIACIGALSRMPYVAIEHGGEGERACHVTAFGACCHGFAGAGVAENLLTIPLALVLLPLSALSLVSASAESADVGGFLHGAAALFFGVSLWAPPIYFARAIHRLTALANPDQSITPSSGTAPERSRTASEGRGGRAASRSLRPSDW